MFRWFINSSLLISLVLTLGQFADLGAPDEPAFVPGELILRFSPEASEADKQEVLAELGATHTRRLGRLRTRHLLSATGRGL